MPVDVERKRTLKGAIAVSGWARYWAWNEAIADHLFSDESAGRSAYLALEEDDLRKLCEDLGEPGDVGSRPLVSAVLATLNLERGRNDFREHLDLLSLRLPTSLETPTSLALLAVLSLAAGQMDASDGMAAHNYYGRLQSLLGLVDGETQHRLQSGYMYAAEHLWAPLNQWLVAWDGSRGVPTAYAVGQRYIGLPMSQALVRRRDRNVMHRIFAAESLPPGYRMGTADMERLLDLWAGRVPSPLSGPLRTLWASPSARERITSVATLELETWDGSDLENERATSSGSTPATARLILSLRTFPRPRLQFALAVPNPDGRQEATLEAETSEGTLSLDAIGSPGGMLRVQDREQVDIASLLADELLLVDPLTGRRFVRMPRRVVVFRHDQLQNSYVESEHIQLGEPCVVIVAAPLAEAARRLLAAVARPGFGELPPSTPGIPDGWVVFRDVHVLARYEGQLHADLGVLLPMTASSLTLLGGFQLPGHLRKWSSLDPPEIQAVSDSATRLQLRIDRGSKIGEAVLVEHIEGSLALVPLKGRGLEDGEYLVTLFADASTRPVTTSVLRLRSAATKTLDAAGATGSLTHSPRTQRWGWALSASGQDFPPASEGGEADVPPDTSCLCGFVAGPEFASVAQAIGLPSQVPTPSAARPTPAVFAHRAVPNPADVETGMPPVRMRPQVAPRESRAGHIRVGRGLGAGSCIRTGAHRFQLPTVQPGPPKSAFVDSECQVCGLQRRFPTRPRKKRDRIGSSVSTLNLSLVPAVPMHAVNDDWSVAFDALCHLGGGTISSFERVAAQIDGSALFSDALMRSLEYLGHLEVERSRDQRPVRWAMVPPALVTLADDLHWLVGTRSGAMVEALNSTVTLWGGRLEAGNDQGIPRVMLRGVAADLLPEVIAEAFPVGAAPGVSSMTSETLVGALPPLSRAASLLPRVPVPHYLTAERWDTETATWQPTNQLGEEGAYRLKGSTTRYGVRTRRSVAEGTIALAGVHLVKHIANAMASDLLAGYHSASGSVVVPLGADLPGIYGRVLALCSGRLPIAIPDHRLLQYTHVSKAVAGTLADRLRV